MDASQPAAPQSIARKGRNTLLVLLGLGLVLLLLAVAASAWWRRGPAPTWSEDLPPAFASPYRNVLPGVKYVGDNACAECHPSHAESYHQHPMSRSLAPVSQSVPLERYGAAAHNPFESLGFHFLAERRTDSMVHKAVRRDPQGRVVTETEADAEIQFVLGSGTRGRSYLLNRDGYLFQSPLSWYTQKSAWDLSPGFEFSYPPERPIEVSCLFCHSNQAQAVEHTRNRYRAPIFRGYGIGCERCHGPGELHADSHRQNPDRADIPDHAIVNPRHLSPALREAVCQQCHLQGEKRIVRRGRQPFDYRPGLPLHQFWSVFVRAPEFAPNQKAVGQVEQMYASRCFQASNGKMGCISCHDPHQLPSAEQSVSYYRERCLDCHQDKGCALSPDARRQQNKDDRCTACHMPRFASSDIAHTAVTDHRILRQQANGGPDFRTPRRLRPGDIPIVNFYEKEWDPQDAAVSRDLGLALIYLAAEPIPGREAIGPVALPLLDKAVQSSPDDAVAWEARGCALSLEGRTTEALAAFETALAQTPQREFTLALAANLAEKMGRPTDAIAYLRRLRAVNPWIWEYRYHLAKVLAQQRQWQSALEECEAALRLNPANEPTRLLLITCCLHCGQNDRARREFQTLVALNPKDDNVLRSWFAEQMP